MPSRVSAWLGSPSPAWSPATLPDDHLADRMTAIAVHGVPSAPRPKTSSTSTCGVHPLFLVEEDYRLALLDAEAAFVDDFVERITHPQTG